MIPGPVRVAVLLLRVSGLLALVAGAIIVVIAVRQDPVNGGAILAGFFNLALGTGLLVVANACRAGDPTGRAVAMTLAGIGLLLSVINLLNGLIDFGLVLNPVVLLLLSSGAARAYFTPAEMPADEVA